MAIRVTGFNKGLRKTLELIVSKNSEEIILATKSRMLKQLRRAAKDWQRVIREALSKPVKGDYKKGTYQRNTSLWPRMQQGRLRNAIKVPTPEAFYRANETSLRKNQIRFKVSNFYTDYVSGVGVTLDEMTDENGKKPFAGWLTRANRQWDLVMKQRLEAK